MALTQKEEVTAWKEGLLVTILNEDDWEASTPGVITNREDGKWGITDENGTVHWVTNVHGLWSDHVVQANRLRDTRDTARWFSSLNVSAVTHPHPSGGAVVSVSDDASLTRLSLLLRGAAASAESQSS